MRVAQRANATVEQAADWWRKNGQAFHQAFVDRWASVDWKTLAEKDPAEVGRLMQQRQEEETLLAEATRRGEADIAAAQAQAEKELGGGAARRERQARRQASRMVRHAAGRPAHLGRSAALPVRQGHRGRPHRRGVYEAPIVEIALNAMRFENAQALAQRARQRFRHGPRRRARASRPRRRLRRACRPGPPTARSTARRMPFARSANASAGAAAHRSPTPPSSSG